MNPVITPVAVHQQDRIVALRQYLDRRLGSLRNERMSWWTHWQELADYILPRRGRFLLTANQGNLGDMRNQKIIDNTGTLAARTLASGLMAGLTSPARPWFRLSLRHSDLDDLPGVRQWLDTVTDRMMQVFAKSNFYNSLAVVYEELGVFGTAAMLILEDPDEVIRTHALTAGEYFLANSERMAVNTLYREFTQTVAQVVARFGLEACSATVRSLFDSGQIDREVMIAHAIEPEDTPTDPDLVWTLKPWRSVYWEIGSGYTQILDVRGFNEFPVCAPRWSLVGNDVYGRSPGMDALGDIRALQIEQKRKAQAIEKMVNPPMVADASLKNQPASLLPGGVTYLPGGGAGIGFRPVYEVNPPLDGLVQDIQEVQGRIGRAFYADLWLMISQLDDVRSAAEIAARREEKLIMLGPVLERLHAELLNPAIHRTFAIMARNQLLPPLPAGLSWNDVAVDYVSPMAQAQKAAAIGGIERLMGFVGQVAAANPSALDNIDVDEAVQDYADMLGVSPKLMMPQAVMDQTRAARARSAAIEQQVTLAERIAKVGDRTADIHLGHGLNMAGVMWTGLMRQAQERAAAADQTSLQTQSRT